MIEIFDSELRAVIESFEIINKKKSEPNFIMYRTLFGLAQRKFWVTQIIFFSDEE